MKLPAFQFYPGDWRKDPNLSRTSLSAKGALIEILCIAFECESRGILQTGKKPWSINEIARAMRGDVDENISAIEELLSLNVLKKNKKGAIFSARMCKDEKVRKLRRGAGLKGGNPVLLKQNSSKTEKSVKQKPTPSSSASASASVKAAEGAPREKIFECMRFALPPEVTDRQIHDEVSSFIERYSGQKIMNLGALVNVWCSHVVPKVKRAVV